MHAMEGSRGHNIDPAMAHANLFGIDVHFKIFNVLPDVLIDGLLQVFKGGGDLMEMGDGAVGRIPLVVVFLGPLYACVVNLSELETFFAEFVIQAFKTFRGQGSEIDRAWEEVLYHLNLRQY